MAQLRVSRILSIFLLFSATSTVFSQVAQFDPTGQTAGTSTSFTATKLDANLNSAATLLIRGTGLSATGTGGDSYLATYNGAAPPTTLSLGTNNHFWNATIVPLSGNLQLITQVSVNASGSNTAANQVQLTFNVGSFNMATAQIGTASTLTSAGILNSFDLVDTLTDENVIVRAYNFGSTSVANGSPGTAGTFRIRATQGAGSPNNGLSVTGSTNSSSSGTISLASNGTTQIAKTTGTLTIAATLTGSNVSVDKVGGGGVNLLAANTYSGSTNVSAGKLIVSNTTGSATGTGSVSVAPGAALASGNTGTITGSVNLAAGSTLTPGDTGSIGTLNVGGATISGSSTTQTTWNVDVDLSSATITGDLLVSTGTNNLTGVTTDGIRLILNSAGASFTPGTGLTFTFAAGTFSNIDSSQFDVRATGFVISNFSVSGGSGLTITFDAAAVPEPATVLLICAGAAALFQTVRRRRKGESEQPLAV